jgi:hypothetical protein
MLESKLDVLDAKAVPRNVLPILLVPLKLNHA